MPYFIFSPIFFPHLAHEEKLRNYARIISLEKQYSEWYTAPKYISCIQTAMDMQLEHNNTNYSLELCAGEEVMSKALSQVGFISCTLDNDQQRFATSKLSLGQLESQIISGAICDHPHLFKHFKVIWSAPECKTWSKASGGSYRNKEFIDGHFNT